MVPLKGCSFPFAPEHLPGWKSMHQWLARRLRAVALERLGSAGYCTETPASPAEFRAVSPNHILDD